MIRKVFIAALMGVLLVVVLVLTKPESDETPGTVTELKLPALSDGDYDWIAARIFQNETAGQVRYLTYWGEGEDFPSFGIGHFIWFPAGFDAPFDETFPDMVSFVQQRSGTDSPMPAWLHELKPFDAPWTSKQQFDQDWPSAKMAHLRQWLEATGSLQARYIVAAFEQRWRSLELPQEQKQQLTGLLQQLTETAGGLFAVIDYYNFKGLGNNPRERYQGQGWGLVQVLESMQQAHIDDPDLVELFRDSAASRLSLRVELSPPERIEERWLEGWLARLDGYVEYEAPTAKVAAMAYRVKPYIQNPRKDAITLIWFSHDKQAGQVRLWEPDSDPNNEERLFESAPVRADALAFHAAETCKTDNCVLPGLPFKHELQLSGLESGLLYRYEVSQNGDSAAGSFQTVAIDERPLRFIVYADSETEPESTGKHASWPGIDNTTGKRKYLVDQTTGYAQNLKVIQQRQPGFIAIAGDLVQSGGEQRDWDEFWLHNSGLAASTFILPALGNHDYFGGPGELGKYMTSDSERAVQKYKAYFDLPPNGSENKAHAERYYALDYGVVTMIVLDGTNGQPNRSDNDTNWRLLGEDEGGVAPDWQPGSEQYRWLVKALRQAQEKSRFTFVMFHGAPWTSGFHGLPPGEGNGQDILSALPLRVLTPLFIEYGVDAVFNGHDEMYEHSILSGFEIAPGGDRREHDTHFYDIGIAGDGLRGPVKNAINPHRVFLAHTDAPEIYGSDGVLKDGGKHYGHLEVNVQRNPDGLWQAQVDAVYIFPLINPDGQVTGFERRLYDDSYTLLE